MSLYDEYETYLKQYKQEYGDYTVVLYQCGSFYEIYSCDDGEVDIRTLCNLLNIQISRRNKAILEVNRSNTMMAGFPDYCLSKFINILVDNQYTVVVVSQVTPPPKPQRAVTQIVSPGTRFLQEDRGFSTETNNLISLYIEDINKDQYVIGISVIDLSTGLSRCGEYSSKNNDLNLPLDEAYRFLTIYNPKEVVIFGHTSLPFASIVSYLELQGKCVHDKINLFPKDYCKVAYQNQCLSNVYPHHGIISPIEYVGLEMMPFALVSFIMVLQFAYNHNENIVQKMSIPEKLIDSRNLEISYNGIKQLNIEALNSLLNKSATAIGKRYFKERLMNPLIDPSSLRDSYDTISIFMKDKMFEQVWNELQNVNDLERLFRKIRLGIIQPADWVQVVQSLESVLKVAALCMTVDNTSFFKQDRLQDIADKCQEFIQFCKGVLDLTEIAKYHLDNISVSFFCRGAFEHIDDLQKEFDDNVKMFYEYSDYLNSIVNVSDKYFKVDNNERDGYFLTITNKRYNDKKDVILKSAFKNLKSQDLTTRPLSSSSNVLRVTHPYFKKLNSDIVETQTKLRDDIINSYKELLKRIDAEFGGCMFSNVVSFIAECDFIATNGKNAFYNKYSCPEIDLDAVKSFIKIEDLRHPIVESIQTQIEYVANDIELGTSEKDGLVLYGVNSAGKSTLMKSCGIAVIMAQAGMFVPCKKMIFKPYKNIFTRIPSGDDIMKGQSTFTVEVGELRNILQRADKNSLVIGDELCSGTESISALSIVSAGIIELSSRGCSFIFASHLHDLVNISRIKNLRNVDVYHLGVFFDDLTGKLIYNRKLCKGQGNTLYGLEVCKSLALGNMFIELANDIRRELIGIEDQILNTKTSHYNKEKYIGKCQICKKKSSDVHHIKEQFKADADGYIGHVHKNKAHNLVCVCEECHDQIHRGELSIEGYFQTSNGVELFSTINGNLNQQDQIDSLVISLAKSGLKVSQILLTLEKDHNISTTRYKVSKILKVAEK